MLILVAYDGSEQARRALMWTTRLGPEPEVTVISIAPALEATSKIADAVDPTSNVQEHRRQLDEAVAALATVNIHAKTLLRTGNPAEEIITAGAEGGFEVILVGIRGMGAVRRFLIGSVADRVVRYATIPVLVVR